jgi:CPA2 family monovalent cation:H+ antiporter-2
MVVASVMALVSYKLNQLMVIGYIIARMIIGTHTPPFSLLIHPDNFHNVIRGKDRM